MLLDVRLLDRRIVKVVKVIDDSDSPIAFGQQTIDEVRADEARAASDENAFHFIRNQPRKGTKSTKGETAELHRLIPFWVPFVPLCGYSFGRIDPQVPAPT